MPSELLGAGYSALAQSESGVRRIRITLADALPSEVGSDVRRIPVHWVYEGVRPGICSVQTGLSRTGGDVHWTQGRIEFEVGDGTWLGRNAGNLPPRLRVRRNKFEAIDGAPHELYSDLNTARNAVDFVRGGNFGNAICWTATPSLNRPGWVGSRDAQRSEVAHDGRRDPRRTGRRTRPARERISRVRRPPRPEGGPPGQWVLG